MSTNFLHLDWHQVENAHSDPGYSALASPPAPNSSSGLIHAVLQMCFLAGEGTFYSDNNYSQNLITLMMCRVVEPLAHPHSRVCGCPSKSPGVDLFCVEVKCFVSCEMGNLWKPVFRGSCTTFRSPSTMLIQQSDTD